jgi:hypothetical protein
MLPARLFIDFYWIHDWVLDFESLENIRVPETMKCESYKMLAVFRNWANFLGQYAPTNDP